VSSEGERLGRSLAGMVEGMLLICMIRKEEKRGGRGGGGEKV